MAFKKVYNIEEADFWLAFEDERRGFLKDRVTPGKYYKLEYLFDSFTGQYEYMIRDDKGDWSVHYLVYRGEFVKEV